MKRKPDASTHLFIYLFLISGLIRAASKALQLISLVGCACTLAHMHHIDYALWIVQNNTVYVHAGLPLAV